VDRTRDPFLEKRLRLLRFLARLAPPARRSAWLREWEAEVATAVVRLREGGAVRRSGGRLRVRTWLAAVDALGLWREELSMEAWRSSLGLALRTLRRSPGFAVLAVALLAIGIGANTAVFSLANWALLRPLPGVTEPGELLAIEARRAGTEGSARLSHPTVERLLTAGPAVASGAAYTSVAVDVMLGPAEAAVRVPGQVVTAGFFETLGVRPALGRTFEEAEGRAGAVHAVAVVSHRFWRERLGSSREVLGRTLTMNGTTFTIVGVAGAEFEGPRRTEAVAVWAPASALPALVPRFPPGLLTMEQAGIWTGVVVRRTAVATPSSVVAQLERSAPELARSELTLHADGRVGISPQLRERLRETIGILVGLVLLLLVLTVANLVNLVLSRVARRKHEVAVRRALGASGGRIVLELAGEGVVLGLTGAGAALVVGTAGLGVLGARGLLAGMVGRDPVPVDARVILFALVAALAAAGAASLLAARVVHRRSGVEVLRQRAGGSVSARRLRRGLVAAQLGVSLALVVGASLAVRSLIALQATPTLGYRPEGVVVFSLNPGVQGYVDADADALFRALAFRIETLPAVDAVGFTWLAPLSGQTYTEQVHALGRDETGEGVTAVANMVTPGYFTALGMDVVEGRTFGPAEYGRADRPERGQVVLNETLARTLFAGEPAIGREIRMAGRSESAFEVIGVVRDARLSTPQAPAGPYLFDPYGNGYRTTSATFAVRTPGDAGALLERIEALVHERDPRLPLLEAGPLRGAVDDALSEVRGLARITTIFAALAVVLAALGLFGLVSEMAQARIHEFGLRSALGARRGDIAALVLRDASIMVSAGTAVGIVAGWIVARALETRLGGTQGIDAAGFVFAAMLLATIAVAACAAPAMRAARVDPVRALQADR
jgi:predicted permease